MGKDRPPKLSLADFGILQGRQREEQFSKGQKDKWRAGLKKDVPDFGRISGLADVKQRKAIARRALSRAKTFLSQSHFEAVVKDAIAVEKRNRRNAFLARIEKDFDIVTVSSIWPELQKDGLVVETIHEDIADYVVFPSAAVEAVNNYFSSIVGKALKYSGEDCPGYAFLINKLRKACNIPPIDIPGDLEFDDLFKTPGNLWAKLMKCTFCGEFSFIENTITYTNQHIHIAHVRVPRAMAMSVFRGFAAIIKPYCRRIRKSIKCKFELKEAPFQVDVSPCVVPQFLGRKTTAGAYIPYTGTCGPHQ